MNQYNDEWTGPRASYKSLEGALGAALRVSQATDAPSVAFVLEAHEGFVVTQDGSAHEEALARGAAVARIVAERPRSRKAKSNSTPPLPTAG